MKKLLLFTALFSLTCLYSQNFEWASKEDFIHATAGFSLASDASGNVYATGIYATTDSTDPAGLYVCKYDPNGNLIWYQKARVKYTQSLEAIAITIDANDNPIVTGTLRDGGMYFYSSNFYVAVHGGMFLSKFNTNGVLQWAFTDGGIKGMQTGKSVSTDKAGNIYVVGSYLDSVFFQGHYLISSPYAAFGYIVKYGSNGHFIWAKPLRTMGDVGTNGISIKSNDSSIYVTGSYLNKSIIDNDTLLPLGDYDIFIAKMDTNGNTKWVQRAGGAPMPTSGTVCPCASGEDDAYALDVDVSGNAYITGGFQGIAHFGNHTVTSAGINTNSAGRDIFIAKYDPTGNCLWANRLGGMGDEWATAITVDALGNSYLNQTGLITKFNSNGSYAWTTNSNAANTGMALGNTPNSLYIGGAFYNSATFGSLSLSSNNVQYGYVVKMTDTTSQPTGITQIKHLQNDLLVYPNPSNGSITISCTLQKRGSACIQVKNSLGQQIYFENIKDALDSFVKQINLGNLSKGIYFVELLQNRRSTIQKVIID